MASPSPGNFWRHGDPDRDHYSAECNGQGYVLRWRGFLDTPPISEGTATLRVLMNAAGSRSLAAHYLGDSNNAAAVSPFIAESVNSVPATGFVAANISLGTPIKDFAVADFNGDGKGHVVVVSGGNFVSVALGNGDSTFGSPIVTSVNVPGTVVSVTTGDFNGDGKIDVAVETGIFGVDQFTGVEILLGNGDGTFGVRSSFVTATGPMTVADFTFSAPNGYQDLFVLDILNSGFLDGIGACYIAYVPIGPTTGCLYLVEDAGDGGYVQGSPIAVPSSCVLLNSQCTVGALTAPSASGNTLALSLNITYNSSFAGDSGILSRREESKHRQFRLASCGGRSECPERCRM